MCFRACAPNTPPLVLPPTNMYDMKYLVCYLIMKAVLLTFHFPLFPLKLLNILVFVLDDGTAGVVTIFIVSTFPV